MAEDPDTWAELKTAVADWLNRSDLTAKIPQFIAFAERKFNRALRVPEMEAVASITADAETESLPADFLEARALYIDTDPKVALEQMTLADLRNTYSASASGRPQNYAIQGGNTLVLGPAPDASYTIKLNYYQKIPALDATNDDNWLLLEHPDVYLWGALLQAEAFIWNDERLAVWKAALEEGLEEIRKAGRHKAHSAAPQRIRAPQVV